MALLFFIVALIAFLVAWITFTEDFDQKSRRDKIISGTAIFISIMFLSLGVWKAFLVLPA